MLYNLKPQVPFGNQVQPYLPPSGYQWPTKDYLKAPQQWHWHPVLIIKLYLMIPPKPFNYLSLVFKNLSQYLVPHLHHPPLKRYRQTPHPLVWLLTAKLNNNLKVMAKKYWTFKTLPVKNGPALVLPHSTVSLYTVYLLNYKIKLN